MTDPGSRGFAGAGRAGVLTAAAVLLTAGGVLCCGETPLWWFGGALVSSAVVLFGRALAPERAALCARLHASATSGAAGERRVRLAAEALCIVIIIAFASVMMADILDGSRPVSRDHTVHFAKAWLLHTQLLPSGRLFGWSAPMVRGLSGQLPVPARRRSVGQRSPRLLLGATSFSASYAIAFWLFHVFSGIAVYRFGRLVGGDLVGLIATLLCLSDLASFRMGGWQYTVEYGVWPQALSLDFGLMGLCSLPALVHTRRLAPLGAFGIWTGLAIITHPMYLIFLGIIVLTGALAAGLADGVRAATAVFRLAARVRALALGRRAVAASVHDFAFRDQLDGRVVGHDVRDGEGPDRRTHVPWHARVRIRVRHHRLS